MAAPRIQLEQKVQTDEIALRPRPWTAEQFTEKFGYVTLITIPDRVQGKHPTPIRFYTRHTNETTREEKTYRFKYAHAWSDKDREEMKKVLAQSAEKNHIREINKVAAALDRYIELVRSYRG